MSRLSRVVEHGRARGLSVSVSGEDASRADPEFVRQILSASRAAGATRFCFVDSYGVMEPIGVHATFRRLRATTDLSLEFRGGNDLGLAAANSVAAVKAGASAVSTCAVAFELGAAYARTAQDIVAGLRELPQVAVRADLDRLAAVADIIVELARRNKRRARSNGRAAPLRALRCP
jgi:homocitrate synthase NifV